MKVNNKIPVNDYKIWKAMISHNHNNDYFYETGYINCDFYQIMINYFCELIDNYHNQIVDFALPIQKIGIAVTKKIKMFFHE